MSTAAAADLQLVPPPRGPLFHLGRGPDPFWWGLPNAINLNTEPPQAAGGRFDDPHGEYATLYCATERYGALLEKLAPLRPIPELPDRILRKLSEPPDPEYDRPIGSKSFPRDFFATLQMGLVNVSPDAQFIDVDHPRTHAGLERYGGKPLLNLLGILRIDRGTFLSPDRRLTRCAAHEIHELVQGLAIGLRYTSAMDADAECWAIWDRGRSSLHAYDVEPVDATSSDLQRALPRLGFELPDLTR